jgi:REP element-mobilizing transposase RayT
MARPWRIEYEGALYHVFSRGNNQQDIFVTDDDRYLFLDTIDQMSERFDIDIFAYALMDNITICCFALQKQIYPEACNGWAPPIRAGLI